MTSDSPHRLDYSRSAPQAWWRRPRKAWFVFVGWLLVIGPIVVMLFVIAVGLTIAIFSRDWPDGSRFITQRGSRPLDVLRLLLCGVVLAPFTAALWYAWRQWLESGR